MLVWALEWKVFREDSRRSQGPEDRMRTGEERKGQAPEQDTQYGTVKWDPSREYNIARTCVHSIECTYERQRFHKSQTRESTP
jgi:hypothetical protein